MTRNLLIFPALTLATLLCGANPSLAQLPGSLPKAPATIPAAMPAPANAPVVVTTAVAPASAMPADTTKAMARTTADSAAAKLDMAVTASNKGDKAATVTALTAGVAAAEAQAAASKGDFKDKLMGQAGNLKKLIPGVQSGLVSGGMVSKAVSLVKMALGANQISSLLGGGGSLLGSVGALTGGLGLMKGALPSLGGDAASTGGSLISSAMSGVSKLSGMGGAAAEPAVKQQLGGVLNFAKGIL